MRQYSGDLSMLKRISHHKVSDLNTFRIVELIQNDVAYVTVFSGKTLFFRSEANCLDEAKQSAINFLSDERKVKGKFAENHRRFLSEQGLPSSTVVKLESLNNGSRETHCFACHSDLHSESHFACSLCQWLICGCGTCGCGYTNYF